MTDMNFLFTPGKRITVHYVGSNDAEHLADGYFVARDDTGILIKPVRGNPRSYQFFASARILSISSRED